MITLHTAAKTILCRYLPLLWLCWASPLWADDSVPYLSGRQLLEECLPLVGTAIDIHAITTDAERNRCVGYLSGFIQTGRYLRQQPGYCLPDGQDDINAVISTVTGYLQDHPEDSGKPATGRIWAALTAAYPCPD